MSEQPCPASFVEHYSTSAYAEFDWTHRAGGTFGLNILDAHQGAVEIVDPAVPEYGFVSCLRADTPGHVDFGDGWRRSATGCDVVDIQPADQDCSFRLPELHLRIAIVPKAAVEGVLVDIGLHPDALHGSMATFHRLSRAARLIDAMWTACARPSPVTNLIIDGAFLQLMAHMLAAAGHDRGAGLVAAIGDHRLARTIDYIETNIAAPLTVGALAAVAAMSPSHFARSFKAATGEAVWAYVQRHRLERAHEMRVLTGVPLAQIAHDCGFTDAGHLSRSYRTRFGAPISST